MPEIDEDGHLHHVVQEYGVLLEEILHLLGREVEWFGAMAVTTLRIELHFVEYNFGELVGECMVATIFQDWPSSS